MIYNEYSVMDKFDLYSNSFKKCTFNIFNRLYIFYFKNNLFKMRSD